MTRLLLLLLLCAGSCLAADYYVSTTGNDGSGDGSAGTPWATCSKAKTIAAAGDTVHVASGFYAERVTLTSSGTAGSPIQFLGPSDRSATNWGFVLNGANYITIGWLTISNSQGAPYSYPDFYSGSGIANYGSHNSFISNTVCQCAGCGIFSDDHPSSSVHATNVLIQGNTVYSNVEVGIFALTGTGGVLRWNEVWGTYASNSFTATDYGDADGIHAFGNGVIVESNYVHGLWCRVGDPFNDPNSPNNPHVDCLQTWYHDADPNNIGLQNAIVRDNVFDAGEGDIVTPMNLQCCTNTVFYNNVFRGHRGAGIITSQSGVYPGGLGFYNNTVIVKSNAAFQALLGDTAGLTTGNMMGMGLTNNLFVADNAVPNNMVINNYGPVNITGGHNLFYCIGPVGFTAYTADATDVLNLDPVLTDAFGTLNFRIAGNSPAKDAGVTMVGFSADIYGTTRPQGSAWDIGAFEFSSGRVVAIWGISTIGKMSQ